PAMRFAWLEAFRQPSDKSISMGHPLQRSGPFSEQGQPWFQIPRPTIPRDVLQRQQRLIQF
ncbi:MAG: hypothetical protein ACKOX5_02720, partial [Bacteroidota bacterium]